MKNLKLSIELVPSTSFYKNLRSILSSSDWNRLRTDSYKKANYRCEICNGIGLKHPVECHEIWSYDDKKHIQKLEGLISLCPSCHEVKHIGLAYLKNRGDIAKSHFKKINNLQDFEASFLIDQSFKQHSKRSQYNWSIDLSWLDDKNIDERSV
jgi:hypothetical protein